MHLNLYKDRKFFIVYSQPYIHPRSYVRQNVLQSSFVSVFLNTASVMLIVENIDTVGKGMFAILTSFGRTVTTMGYFTYIMYPIML
jgi:hypothetical protein